MDFKIIEHHIGNLLLERKHAVVPGLGVFFLKSVPARIDLSSEKIYPPGFSIEFFNAPGISDYLLAYRAATQSSFNFGAWTGFIDDFTRKLHDLGEGEKIELANLGTFTKGEELDFRPDPKWGSGEILGRVPLSCKAIKTTPETAQTESSKSVSVAASKLDEGKPNLTESKSSAAQPLPAKSSKFRRRLIFGLLLLTGLIFGFLIFNHFNRSSEPVVEIPAHISEDRFNRTPDNLYVDSFDQSQSSEDSVENEPRYENEHPEESYTESPEVADEEGENALDTPNPESCVIVSGSFSSSSNVNRMTEIIQSHGYPVYKEGVGDLVRVGAIVNCNPGELEAHLSYIRENIEQASWLLE